MSTEPSRLRRWASLPYDETPGGSNNSSSSNNNNNRPAVRKNIFGRKKHAVVRENSAADRHAPARDPRDELHLELLGNANGNGNHRHNPYHDASETVRTHGAPTVKKNRRATTEDYHHHRPAGGREDSVVNRKPVPRSPLEELMAERAAAAAAEGGGLKSKGGGGDRQNGGANGDDDDDDRGTGGRSPPRRRRSKLKEKLTAKSSAKKGTDNEDHSKATKSTSTAELSAKKVPDDDDDDDDHSPRHRSHHSRKARRRPRKAKAPPVDDDLDDDDIMDRSFFNGHGEEDDGGPLMPSRPSAPPRRHRHHRHNNNNRGRLDRGGQAAAIATATCAFDVDRARASAMKRLSEEEEQQYDDYDDADDTARAFVPAIAASSSSGMRRGDPRGTTAPRTSLTTCLEDMGFDPGDVRKAILENGAEGSGDAAKVAAWLGDRTGGNVGGSSSTSTTTTTARGDGDREAIGSDDYGDRGVRDAADDDDDRTNYTKHTHNTNNTNDTNGTNGTSETQESDPDVRRVRESLKSMGFDKEDVRQHEKLYKRHSDKMEPDDFIAVMLEGEASGSATEEEEEGAEMAEGRGAVAAGDAECGGCIAVVSDAGPPAPVASPGTDDGEYKPAPIARRPRLHRRLPGDSQLVSSLTEMGFEAGRVEAVIGEMREKGAEVSMGEVDDVLGALLGGDVGGGGDAGGTTACGATAGTNDADAGGGYPPAATPAPEQEEDGAGIKIEITPGKYARLLKGRRTWEAVKDGTAASARCTICDVILQCAPEAAFVLCPDCDVVSPLLHNGGTTPGSCFGTCPGSRVGAVGLGYKSKGCT